MKPDAQGQCFKWALDKLETFPSSARLVHATVHDLWDGHAYSHAWIETRTRVFDWQCSVGLGPGLKGWTKKKFYAAYKPTDVKTYTHEEGLIKMLRSKHWGPWT